MFGGVGGMLFLLLPIALIFFMTRSQSKKQKDLESSLKVGDRVITRAGALGKIVKMGDRAVELELAPGVFVSFLRSSIEGLDLGDPKKEPHDWLLWTNDVSMVALGDGSVRTVAKKVNPASLHAYITRAGGEVVDE